VAVLVSSEVCAVPALLVVIIMSASNITIILINSRQHTFVTGIPYVSFIHLKPAGKQTDRQTGLLQ